MLKMNKDQSIGALIFIICITIAVVYPVTLLLPALEAIRLWLIAIPVLIAFIGVLAIGAWIGWTMASTPPPKPIEDSDLAAPEEPKTTEST
jgi:predicted DNA-binding transcriptional regulator